MIRLEPALLLGAIGHGETGAVVRLLTAETGMLAAYVHGARGRRLRPMLQVGNVLGVDLVTRGDDRLPLATPHLLAANLAMLHGPVALAVVDHVAALISTLLPDAVPQPRLYGMVDALLMAAGSGAAAHTLGIALARLELALLDELGLGLDLSSCAASGAREDLAFVSPRSRQAVARGPGQPWASRLLPLPAFLIGDRDADAQAVGDGLRLTGHFLARDALAGTRQRERLLQGRARAVTLLTAAA
ncbi:DNA repair protein RecO [Sandarakinorhabdus cyanobacteriorum]|uniref:DNA repair protein RecO n=1 Tax=Sandarakinorhabdus cyanobacteriorum TaxID=1981098 RepID=A0A255YJG5_9SPHN|nr:DNA repair protein RecO [Sandarakinorhabdus cyanobacteriorum]OYQ29412.1 DNA repair protein RecO [Sandarakinorhabdus cyanobacteriorum]